MASRVQTKSGDTIRHRPALDPRVRETQLVGYALDLAEQQLLDGTATSQVLTHFLKLGTETTKLERLKLEQEIELARAKTQEHERYAHIEELYTEAISAMREYQGVSPGPVQEGGDPYA